MTVEEMGEKILACVEKTGGGTTFVELMQAVGEEAHGEYAMEYPDNIVWWVGMSKPFVDAMQSDPVRQRIEPSSASVFVYMMDGALPKLPRVKRVRQYKKPHWIPVVFNLKKKR